jgi:hypothetical protein
VTLLLLLLLPLLLLLVVVVVVVVVVMLCRRAAGDFLPSLRPCPLLLLVGAGMCPGNLVNTWL